MSWWDSSGFGNLASQALNAAQKQIDKVLDIKEDAQKNRTSTSRVSTGSSSGAKTTEDDSFFNTWLSSTDTQSSDKKSASLSASETPTSSLAKTKRTPPSLPISLSSRQTVGKRATSPTSLPQSKKELKSESSAFETPHRPSAARGRGKLELSSPEAASPGAGSEVKSISPLTLSGSEDVQSAGTKTVVKVDEKLKSSAIDPEDGKHLSEPKHTKNDELKGNVQDVSDVNAGSEVKGLTEPETDVSCDQGVTEVEPQVVLTESKEASNTEPSELSPSLKTGPSAAAVLTVSMQSGDGWAVDSLVLDDQLRDMMASKDSDAFSDNNSLQPAIFIEETIGHDTNTVNQSAGHDTNTVNQSAGHDTSTVNQSAVSVHNPEAEVVGKNFEKDAFKCPEAEVEEAAAMTTDETRADDVTLNKTNADDTDAPVDEEKEITKTDDAAQTLPDQAAADSAGSASVSDDGVNQEDSHAKGEPVDISAQDEVGLDGDSSLAVVDINRNASTSTLSAEDLSDSNRTLTNEDLIGTSSDSDKISVQLSDTAAREVAAESVTDADTAQGADGECGPQEITASMASNVSDCSSNSLVKNMLEEAMVESSKDNDSHSTTSTERSSSDMVRIESGMNSGHTSADEIDTTTSSDIEIISTPTPNGDGHHHTFRPLDLSPLRHAFSRGIRRSSPPGHKRSDSGSSSQSRNGDDILGCEGPPHRRPPHRVSEHGELPGTCGHSTEGADGNQNVNSPQADRLLKKLAEMAEVLDARERKLVELSRQNMELQEDNTILRNQLHQAEENLKAENTDLERLTTEFTARIGETDKKLQATIRERDIMKQQMERLMEAKQSDFTSLEMSLIEKDETISELMAEGEKLSKQQLQSNNIIKKLRAKEKENETLLKSQKDKLEKQKTELDKLTKVLDAKEDMEKKQNDAIGQLNTAVQRYEREVGMLKSDLEDAQEKMRSMQVALDHSYKEIGDLHKANASRASEAQEAALSAEIQAKQKLQISLDKAQYNSKLEQEALITQVEDLRLSVSRMEKEHGRREDILRQEIADLQQRLQEAEDRNQELSQSVTQATRPLLRQIENLQSTYAAQGTSYEKVERNLTERLSEAQTQLALAVEKERSASEKVIELSSRVTSLESTSSSLRQEKSRLSAELEMEKARIEVLEEAKHGDKVQLEALKQTFDREVSGIKKDKLLIENQLEMEKMKVESEKKKVQIAHEQLREKEKQIQTARAAVPSPTYSRESSVPPLSRETSISSDMMHMFTPISQDEVLEKTLMIASPNGSRTSLYETLRQTGAATLLENLESQLKMKEGEISQLQSEIGELERTREAMARELVNLTTTNETLQDQVKELPVVQKQYRELDQRYNAILQMYGEKEEEVQELRLDLQDVKDMYKSQINELLKHQ